MQVANALIRSTKHVEFSERYRRLKARRGHMKAVIAICRMLLTAIWNILSKHVPYTAEGFLQRRPVKPEKILTVAEGLYLLRLRGYEIRGISAGAT